MPKTATRRPRATKSGREVDEREKSHLRRCRSEFPYYAKTHLKIRTKSGGLKPFRLNPAQELVHKKISDQLKRIGKVRVIILKARQEGISTYVAGRFFRKIHLFSYQRAAVIAHEREKSSDIFEFYDRMYQNLMEEMRPDAFSTQKGNVLHLVNDSQLVVETANDPEAARGTTLQCVHGSEVASWNNAQDVMVSIFNAVGEEGTEIILESTAKGVGNEFHTMWEEAYEGHGLAEGTNGFLAVFLPWWIHPEYQIELSDEERLEVQTSTDPWERNAMDVGFQFEGEMVTLTPEQVAWRRKIGIPEKCRGSLRKFQQEYPSYPEEAFIATGDTFFDKDSLEFHKSKQRRPQFRGTLTKKDDVIVPRGDGLGHLRIWEFPSPKGRYVISADTATGKSATSDPDDEKGGRDFSCADVIRVNGPFNLKDGRVVRCKQVAQLHGRMPPEVFTQHLENLGYFYRTALIAPERNYKSGETVVNKLYFDLNYPNVYYARQINVRSEGRITPRAGWWTTKVTRPIMLDELAEAARNDYIEIPCPETVREMFTFILDEKGVPRAMDGTHDDRVMCLAIGYQLATTTTHEEPKGRLPEPEIYSSPSGAFDYGWG